ncbi:hypothetical protein ALT721_2340032 [Alteromonas alvinellae]
MPWQRVDKPSTHGHLHTINTAMERAALATGWSVPLEQTASSSGW